MLFFFLIIIGVLFKMIKNKLFSIF